MSDLDKTYVESDLKTFTTRHFERPADCRNTEQIRFYINELCLKIEECRLRFNYVPNWAYALLAQYNARQNNILYHDFRRTYC